MPAFITPAPTGKVRLKWPTRTEAGAPGRSGRVVVRRVDPRTLGIEPLTAEEQRLKALAEAMDRAPLSVDTKPGYHDPDTALKQWREGK